MNNKAAAIVSIVFIVISAVLAVVSYIYLPSTVITQLSISGKASSTSPRFIAIALPTLLGLGGAFATLFNKGNTGKLRPLFISGVGVIIFIIMLAVNI